MHLDGCLVIYLCGIECAVLYVHFVDLGAFVIHHDGFAVGVELALLHVDSRTGRCVVEESIAVETVLCRYVERTVLDVCDAAAAAFWLINLIADLASL